MDGHPRCRQRGSQYELGSKSQWYHCCDVPCMCSTQICEGPSFWHSRLQWNSVMFWHHHGAKIACIQHSQDAGTPWVLVWPERQAWQRCSKWAGLVEISDHLGAISWGFRGCCSKAWVVITGHCGRVPAGHWDRGYLWHTQSLIWQLLGTLSHAISV